MIEKRKKIYSDYDATLELFGETCPPLLKDHIKNLQKILERLESQGRTDIRIALDASGYAHPEVTIQSVREETDEEYQARVDEQELKNLLEEQDRVKKLMKAAKTMIDLDPHTGVSLDTYSSKLTRIRKRIAEIKEERKK